MLFGALVFFVLGGFGRFGTPERAGAGPSAAERAAIVGPATPRAPAPRVNRFDEQRALRIVKRQLAFGQRPAGSKALRRTAEMLRPWLPRGRFEQISKHPGLRNIVGSIPGRRPALLIGAHYDTEARPPGFVGANDSAAGTAALVEVARALRKLDRSSRAREVRFVLFDGEEEPPEGDGGDFYANALRGSKAYAAAHVDEIKAMVLLDYVGNANLRLPREGSSDPELWKRLRTAAATVGVQSVFPDEDGETLLDDHTPFLQAGIPAIDLIDFSYRHKDTVRDTVDKLDVRSLDAVGEAVVELVRGLDRAGY